MRGWPRKRVSHRRSSRRSVPASHRPSRATSRRSPRSARGWPWAFEYLETNRVSAPNYKRAVDAFGEQGVVDLVGVCGYYMLVSMTLNVFEMPLPPGEPEPLA